MIFDWVFEQMVLDMLLTNHTSEELFSLPSMKSAIAGLLMYNERHMQRYAVTSYVSRAKEDSYQLNFM